MNFIESEMRKEIEEAIDILSSLTCVQWMEKSSKVAKLVGHSDYVKIEDDGRYRNFMITT